MERVSVIVPVYNVEPYLHRCIQSLTNQTYPEIEILLVDDLSDDGSRRVMEEFAEKDHRVRCIFHEKNKGVSAARNTGLDQASGEWICFCDGDDWYALEYIEKMLTCAKQNKADFVVCGDQIAFDNRPSIVLNNVDLFFSGCDSRKLIACGSISSCTHMIRRDLFDRSKARYIEGCSQYEELPVIPLLAKYASKIGVVREPLYFYYQRGNGTSASNCQNGRYEEDFINNLSALGESLGKGYERELEYRGIYALLYGMILTMCKGGASRAEVCKKIDEYENLYSDYISNPYLQYLGYGKRVFLWLERKRCILGLRLLAWIHGKIIA